MKPITINAFMGAALALDDLLLPDGVGVVSINQRPGFGDLRPWNQPGGAVASVTAGYQTLHRMTVGVASDAMYWLAWPGVVHAATGFDTQDTTERTYFTGAGTPKWTNNVMALSGGPPYPQASRELGVPAPSTALTATVNTAATGDAEQVSFQWVYTFVNDLGWESAPSPVSNTLLQIPGTTFNLAGFAAPPAGNYGITKVRLYRYVPGSSTSGGFFFIREWATGSTPANPQDDARAADTDPIETSGWRPCPGIPNGGSSGLTEATAFGMVKLWNGMHAVLSGNSMRPCEPYKPYAYPLAYEVGTSAQPVAIGVWGQRAIILTKGDATLVSGSSPDSLDAEPASINRPCTSARGVVSFNEGATTKGVVWPSEEGLCWYGDGGFRMLTEGLLTRDQWQALAPSTMVAGRHGRFYVCFYNDGSLKGFVVDPASPPGAPSGMYFLSTGYGACFTDPVTDRLYVLDAGGVKRWDAGAALTATFRSKRIRLPAPMAIGAIEVIAKGYPARVRYWADDVLVLDQDATSDNPLRPPGGFLPDEIQVEIVSSSRVIAIRLAQRPEDLRQA